MTCVHLHDAYYSIPMSSSFRKYLKFAWRGRLYQFRALPIGLPSSPGIFTKVLMIRPVSLYLWHILIGKESDSFPVFMAHFNRERK